MDIATALISYFVVGIVTCVSLLGLAMRDVADISERRHRR